MQETTSPLKLIYDDLSPFNGYVHIYTKHNDKMRPVAFCLRSEAFQNIEQLKIHKSCDYYITANTTIADKRQKAYLLSYNNIVIDVDCHSDEEPADLRKLAIDTLIDKLQGLDIPQASIIHRTGRGVQLWYHIEQISAKLFFLYEKACGLLCSALEYIISENPTACACLSVDRGASLNSVGLFRLFNSYNTKTNTKTECIVNDNIYTIHSLLEQLNNSEDIPQALLPEPETVEHKRTIHCIDCNYVNLQRGRMNVLEQLASEQDGEGMREIILFLYYNSAFQVCEPATAESLTIKLNTSMPAPLPSSELAHIFCCIDKKYYKYKQKTFCQVLGITQEYFLEYSNPRAKEREKCRMDKQKRKEMAETLKASGRYTNKEIAELTGYSVKTINRIEIYKPADEKKPWELIGVSRATYYRNKK